MLGNPRAIVLLNFASALSSVGARHAVPARATYTKRAIYWDDSLLATFHA